MAQERTQRRLAAILAADVVGYSRLVGKDEEGTIARLQALREELIGPAITQHQGRIVKTTGDSILVEFSSVVDAVRSAAAMQRALAEREANVPEERHIAFRVGVNLGDIVIDGDDILGDGVNVAARLEGLASPGGICVSGDVFRQIEGKLDLGFEDLGERQVKNIEKPVRVFRVLLEPEAAGTVILEKAKRPRVLPLSAVAVAAAAVVAVAVTSVWWQPLVEGVKPASEKPSIAVLPFDNKSGEMSQEYFADGLTEDIITDLSKISGLFVIARNSSFAYKGKDADLRTIGRELGVKYILEGSVRRTRDSVRINAQLVDAETGGQLWAERYDGTLSDVFALQDKVTGQIVAQLAVQLTASEEAQVTTRETDDPAAFDAYLQGREYFRRGSPTDYARAIPHLEEAIRLDPDYGRAYATLAEVYRDAAYLGWFLADVSPSESAERADRYLKLAAKHPTPLAHQVAARTLLRQGRHVEALAEAEQAIVLNPNDPSGHIAMAEALIWSNRPAEALLHVGQAMRLDPHYPAHYLALMGMAQFAAGRFDEAAATMNRATQRNPDRYGYFTLLAASLGQLGRKQQAKSAVERANGERSKNQRPDLNVAVVAFWPAPIRESMARGLRLANVPELPFGYAGRAEDKLTADEIRSLLFGKTYHGFDPYSGGGWITSISEDGSTVTESPWYSGRQMRWIENDTLCFRNEGSATSAKVCALVFRNPDGTPEGRDEYHWVGGAGVYPFSVCDCAPLNR